MSRSKGGEKVSIVSDARNYLQRIRNITFRIQQLEEEEKLIDRSILKAQTYDKDRVQSSPRADGLENDVIKYINKWEAMVNETIAKRQELMTLRRQALNTMQYIVSDKQRDLLNLRYIQCKDWETIADKLEIEVNSAYRLHKRAVMSFGVAMKMLN